MNWDKYEKYRIELQNEVNKDVIKPMSFEVFKKSKEEKEALKKAKRNAR